jgi:AmmeMemoRadiSam system protein B
MSPIRPPAVAGRFYPAGAAECRSMLDEIVRPVNVDGHPIGAVVPHAGWVYSGPTAALGISAVGAAQPETVVLFGAVHAMDANHASLYPVGAWETPLGLAPVDEELAASVMRHPQIAVNPAGHMYEHSIEVQLPLIQHILGDIKILPINVRPGETAAEIGRVVATEIRESGRSVVFLASTDLTHYGPAFGFEPHGHGLGGTRWAKEVNDRRFIDLIAALDADGVVPEAASHHNACGAGAVAAGIAAALELGAQSYVELEHTTSADKELEAGGRATNSVGYEAGVFTRPK